MAAITNYIAPIDGEERVVGARVGAVLFMLDLEAHTVASNPYLGDVDGNGVVNSSDASLALKFAVGSATPTDAQRVTADVTYEGFIDTTDSRLILQRATGKT